MGVNYRPLWIELAKRQMKKTEFQEVAGISSNLVAKMGKNEYISMKNLEKICRTMNLSPCEIIEFKDKGEDHNE